MKNHYCYRKQYFRAILYRQIAGALARKCKYAEEGMQVIKGTDAGFIKFGSSRFILPLGTKVDVVLNKKQLVVKQSLR
jgi:phosphatidylserine decarboxylase